MDFGFWDNLLRECFNVNRDKKALWPQCLKGVFPGYPTSEPLTNETIRQKIEKIRNSRNSISHHSPVWSKNNVNNESDVIKYINELIDSIVKVLSWISGEKLALIERHSLVKDARRTGSKKMLNWYKRDFHDAQDLCDLPKSLESIKENDFILTGNNKVPEFMITRI